MSKVILYDDQEAKHPTRTEGVTENVEDLQDSGALPASKMKEEDPEVTGIAREEVTDGHVVDTPL